MTESLPIDKALEIWSVQTLCDTGILLSIFSFLLHLGRPYFERILARLTLRVAADIWWLIYVALRDGALFLAFLFGFMTMNLDMMADIKIGLPFVPIGTAVIAWALHVKVFRNAEDLDGSFRLATYWTALGALLNTIGYVMVMECPGDEYAAAKTAFWATLDGWKSNKNPEFATVTYYIATVLLILVTLSAAINAVRAFRGAGNKAEK